MQLTAHLCRRVVCCVTLAACLAAFLVGSVVAAISTDFYDVQIGMVTANVAILTAIAALIGQLTPWIRAYFEDKKLQRQLSYRRQLIDERLESLERRQDGFYKLIGSLRAALLEDRTWMLMMHAKYPDDPLPVSFGNRDFDQLMNILDLIPPAHPKAATVDQPADTSLPDDLGKDMESKKEPKDGPRESNQ